MGLQEGGLNFRDHDQREDEEQRQDTDVHGAGEATTEHAFRRLRQFFRHQETDQQHDADDGQRRAVCLRGDGRYGRGYGRYHNVLPLVLRGEKIACRGQLSNINTILVEAQSVNRTFDLTNTLQNGSGMA